MKWKVCGVILQNRVHWSLSCFLNKAHIPEPPESDLHLCLLGFLQSQFSRRFRSVAAALSAPRPAPALGLSSVLSLPGCHSPTSSPCPNIPVWPNLQDPIQIPQPLKRLPDSPMSGVHPVAMYVSTNK